MFLKGKITRGVYLLKEKNSLGIKKLMDIKNKKIVYM
jgi:hypothetical protein